MNPLVILILLLNLAISWFNAHQAGKMLPALKYVGTWQKIVTYSVLTMATIGFTYIFVLIYGIIAAATGFLPPEALAALFQLTFVMIAFPLLGTGFIMTIQSWKVAKRNGGLLNYGIAGYNTFAQIHNTYTVIKYFPGSLKAVGEFFASALKGDGDVKAKAAILVIAILIVGLLSGILLTSAIARRSAKNSLPEWKPHFDQAAA